MKEKFLIVGGLPALNNAGGGVVTFLRRLFLRDASKIRFFYDRTKGDKSYLPNHNKIISVKNLLHLLFRLAFDNIHKDDIIFFNFSRERAFLFLLIVPKRCFWQLMLHHGVLKYPKSLLFRFLYSIAMKKIDLIYSLNQNQKKFYLKSHYHGKIVDTHSYIAATKNLEDPDALEILQMLKKRFSKIFIASGPPLDIYRHEWCIEYFSKKEHSNDAFLLFLYQGDISSYKNLNLPLNIRIFYRKDEVYFNTCLMHCDCYIRPFIQESFGIAVSDAISFGKEAIASDACKRPVGTIICRNNDKQDFFNKIDKFSLLQGQKKVLFEQFELEG